MAGGLRHGEGSVERRPRADGTTAYRATWRGEGGRQRRRTFDTEAAAVAHLEEVYRHKRRGTYRDPAALTVNELVADHLWRGAGEWSGGTLRTYEQRAAAHITPHIGSLRVASLTTHRVQQWIDQLGRKGLAPATIQPTVAILAGALAHAKRLGLIEVNVAQGVRLPTVRAPKMEVWTQAEARAVLACVKADPRWHAVYQVMLSVGLRPGELRALRWEDVDLAHARLHVRRTVTKDGVREGTKRGTGRVVPLTLPAVASLRAWRETQATGYVFGGARPLANMTWVRAHDRLCDEAGVKRITLHSLRHTCATLLLEQGVHPRIVSEIMGHSSVQMTLDRYSHPNLDMMRRASESVSASLESDDVTPALPVRNVDHG